jgi:hypothetical protein
MNAIYDKALARQGQIRSEATLDVAIVSWHFVCIRVDGNLVASRDECGAKPHYARFSPRFDCKGFQRIWFGQSCDGEGQRRFKVDDLARQ